MKVCQISMSKDFNSEKAMQRCLKYRLRILEISQNVGALHIGSAYSCTEIVDTIYNDLMKKNKKKLTDIFLMSKGHGCMIQYVILEDLGILKKDDIDSYCTKKGILGVHPDYGNPGIEASTGSLGHGLSLAVGMALAEKTGKLKKTIYTVLSDGEMQEGSTWEAFMMASSLNANNLIAYIDNNDFQSLGRTSVTHPSFYPLEEKLKSFGWDCFTVDGHNSKEIYDASLKKGNKPLALVCKTTKGKGISYMENIPIWHYRSPNKEEYEIGKKELTKKLIT